MVSVSVRVVAWIRLQAMAGTEVGVMLRVRVMVGARAGVMTGAGVRVRKRIRFQARGLVDVQG
jgi:hypothetical protein